MTKRNIKALQLTSRFSLPPNSLGYCGRNSATEKLKKCVIQGKCDGVAKEITKFIVLYPYLKTIAKMAKLSFTSYDVVECFWLGNNLLKKANLSHYDLLLKNFVKQGVPAWLIDELKKRKPKKFIPFHLFQILHVGVGRAGGAVPFNLDSITNCMVRWGKVDSINENTAKITLNSLEKKKGKYSLVLVKETHSFILEFLPNLKIGDTVAVHWKLITKILNAKEEKSLTYWTNKVLDSQN